MGKSFYERAAQRVWQNTTADARLVKIGDKGITVLMYLVYIVALGMLLAENRWVDLALLIGTTGSGFILVTAMRHFLSSPRPYEVYAFKPPLGYHRPGRSFPSRHAYSATVITAAWVWLLGWPALGALGLLTLCQMLFRVIGGVHFIRDVLAGAALGALFGGIGFWLIPWLFF